MNKCQGCQAEIKLGAKRCRECANAKNLDDRIKYRERIKLEQHDSVCRYCDKKFKKSAGKQRFCGITCRELNTVKRMLDKWAKQEILTQEGATQDNSTKAKQTTKLSKRK